MILEEIRQLKTGERELRRFGLLVGGVFAALGLLMGVRGKAFYPYLLAPGGVLALLGAFYPKGLKLVYVAWMTLAIALGFVVSNVLLTLFFFFVITPVGLVARLFGRDFLRLKMEREASSYWIAREPAAQSKSDYERQF